MRANTRSVLVFYERPCSNRRSTPSDEPAEAMIQNIATPRPTKPARLLTVFMETVQIGIVCATSTQRFEGQVRRLRAGRDRKYDTTSHGAADLIDQGSSPHSDFSFAVRRAAGPIKSCRSSLDNQNGTQIADFIVSALQFSAFATSTPTDVSSRITHESHCRWTRALINDCRQLGRSYTKTEWPLGNKLNLTFVGLTASH